MPNPRNSLSNKSVFVISEALGSHLGLWYEMTQDGVAHHKDQPWDQGAGAWSPPQLWGGEGGWRLSSNT